MTGTASVSLPAPAGAGRDPLGVVQAALLEQARTQAVAMREEAERDAAATLARARTDADDVRQEARQQGERDAEALRQDQRARARRRARGIVLTAQRQALDLLRQQAHDAARALLDDPELGARLHAGLTARARADLGPDAVVQDRPGGVEAVAGAVRATYLVPDLVDDVLDRMGADLAGLWSP